MNDKNENHEVIKREGKSPYFWLNLGGSVIVVISWLVLIGLKLSSNISLKIPITISTIVTIIGIFTLIGTNLAKNKDKYQEEKDIKKPITKEEAREMVYKIIEDRWDHIRQPEQEGIIDITTDTGTKGDQVYKFEVQPLYGEPIYIIINATYPETMPTITLCEKVKNPTLNKLVNAKFQSPKETDTTEEVIENPMTGIKKTTKKTVTKKKEEEKQEDLV